MYYEDFCLKILVLKFLVLFFARQTFNLIYDEPSEYTLEILESLLHEKIIRSQIYVCSPSSELVKAEKLCRGTVSSYHKNLVLLFSGKDVAALEDQYTYALAVVVNWEHSISCTIDLVVFFLSLAVNF